jgi:hypothetical protein
MIASDEILRAHRQISTLSGTARIALWLIVGTGVLCVIDTAVAAKEKASILSAVSGPVLTMTVCALTRHTCLRQMRQLETATTRENA